MRRVSGKLASAVRIAREFGLPGLLHAMGRNLGFASMQAGLDESDIAWDFFSRQAQPGTMIDIGAHFGSALRPFVRNGWDVFAFEPDVKNRAHLLDEFAGYSNLKIDPRAVSDQVQHGVTFYRSDISSGISGLSAFDPSHRASDKINVTTMTDFLAVSNVRSIDFLKIDTEGHDLFVLRGMPWQTVRPRLVLCEFENHKTEALGYCYEDLVNYLTDKGYKVITSEWHPIERYGVNHRWHRFAEGNPPQLINPQGWGNILAVRDHADLDLLRAACARAANRVAKIAR